MVMKPRKAKKSNMTSGSRKKTGILHTQQTYVEKAWLGAVLVWRHSRCQALLLTVRYF